MIEKTCRFFALLFSVVILFSLSACVTGVYQYDDAKKSYDKQYEPAAKVPETLSDDTLTAIKNAAADAWNTEKQIAYEDALTAYNEAVISDALSAAADSSERQAASEAGSKYISTYTAAQLTEPEVPETKSAEDIKFYTYGGTYNGYTAVKYKVKDKAVVAAHQTVNLKEDVIGNYNFSYYPDSPGLALYKDGVFYSIREIYESGGITDTQLKDIWYYFYIVDNQ